MQPPVATAEEGSSDGPLRQIVRRALERQDKQMTDRLLHRLERFVDTQKQDGRLRRKQMEMDAKFAERRRKRIERHMQVNTQYQTHSPRIPSPSATSFKDDRAASGKITKQTGLPADVPAVEKTENEKRCHTTPSPRSADAALRRLSTLPPMEAAFRRREQANAVLSRGGESKSSARPFGGRVSLTGRGTRASSIVAGFREARPFLGSAGRERAVVEGVFQLARRAGQSSTDEHVFRIRSSRAREVLSRQ